MGLGQSLRAVVGQLGGAHTYDDDYNDDAFAVRVAFESGDSDECDAIYRDESFVPPRQAKQRSGRPLAIVRPAGVQFSLVSPQDFDDARQIADRLRAGGPVIVDLQGCGPDLSKRLTDFCSGLAYALEGRLQCIGETVVLLAPHTVELSSEALGGLQERRFFNQV